MTGATMQSPAATTRGTGPDGAQRVRELIEYSLLANARPATVETIVRDMTPPDEALVTGGVASLDEALHQALAALVREGQVTRIEDGIEHGFVPRACAADVSRRARVRTLVGRAALLHGRAVRSVEVWNYAVTYAPGEVQVGALTKTNVTHDIQNLTAHKLVVVIGTVRGENNGSNLVVPANFVGDGTSWRPTEPVTWLDYVVDGMDRMLAAADRDTFTARELRAFLAEDIVARRAANRPTPVGLLGALRFRATLSALASSSDPVVAPVSGRLAVWRRLTLSAGSGIETASPQYATDTDRIMEAARRVTVETGRPVVTVHDIRQALDADPSLTLSNGKELHAALTDLAKERIAVGTGRSAARRVQRVRRVGVMDGNTAYWVATGTDDDARWHAAQQFVASHGVFEAVTGGAFIERIARLKTVVSPVIATGRARHILRELTDLQARVQALPATIPGRAEYAAQLEQHTAAVRGWLKFRSAQVPGMPSDIHLGAPGLTANALRDLFAPVNTRTAAMHGTKTIVPHYSRLVRRFPNPQFKGRLSGDPATAALFLFDRVDAIGYAARQWGGAKCQLHALWAVEELGELRDARYALVALASESSAVRQRVIGTLALLAPPDAADTLLHHLRNDIDAGVRECALWALGLVMGEAATAVLTEVVTHDPDANVRRTARAYLTLGDSWWWRA